MKTLITGENIAIANNHLNIKITWEKADSCELSTAAFLLNKQNRISSDDDIVCTTQQDAVDGAVSLDFSDDYICFIFDLDCIPDTVGNIPIVVKIQGDQGLSALSSMKVVIDELAVFEPDLNNRNSTLLPINVYRKNGVWKLRAVGQVIPGSDEQVKSVFGIHALTPFSIPIFKQRVPKNPKPASIKFLLKSVGFYWHTGYKRIAIMGMLASILVTTLLFGTILTDFTALGVGLYLVVIALSAMLDTLGLILIVTYFIFFRFYIPESLLTVDVRPRVDHIALLFSYPIIASFIINRVSTFSVAKLFEYPFPVRD